MAVVLLILSAALIKRMWNSKETKTETVTARRLEEGSKRSDNVNVVSAGNGSIKNNESEWEYDKDDYDETPQVD